ncbi:hypothetical protein ACFV7R_22110 [Streptomyces sp. NPDC059866]|uniref:hypothetical protein n=1 Tax=Streptomyces sp. NPDC059866 TaxID=3346978 RepID=UPI0036595F44
MTGRRVVVAQENTTSTMIKESSMAFMRCVTRTRMAVLGASLAVVTGALSAAAPASADDVDAVYLGTRKGEVDVLGGGYKWQYSDKQYRSLMTRNTRNHYIHVSYKGCKEWRVRIAAAHPEGGYTDDETTVKGCNKTAVVSIIGKMNANVTLSVYLPVSGDTRAVAIKPIN